MQTKCVSRVQLESSSLIQLRIKEMVVVDKLLCGNSVSLSVLFFFFFFTSGAAKKNGESDRTFDLIAVEITARRVKTR